MANPDFEIVPFVFQPARDEGGSQTWQAWEGERRGGAAPPRPARASRATRASPARPQRKLPPPRPSPRPRPRPPALRRPLDAARFVGWPDTREPAEPRDPCICPAHGTEYVRWVQSALNRIEGLALPVDGVMSAATRSALRAFQGRNNLPADGIAGPDTEQVLRDAGRPADAGTAPAEPPSEPAQDQGEFYEFETLELESPANMPTVRQGSRGAAVADLQRRLAAASFSPGDAEEPALDEVGWIEPEQESHSPAAPARPLFRFECAAGCAPFPPGQCRTVLQRAIRDAISLATNAANKLQANPRDTKTTVRLFRAFFGHPPSRPVHWANNQESGAVVAQRFRECAKELGGGRRTLYRCGCPGAGPGVRARTIGPVEVRLCAPFWNASPQPGLSDRFFRAGVILHEMLHQLFLEFIRHDPNERRRNNAHCYEAFAMRLAGHAADRSDVTQCLDRPA